MTFADIDTESVSLDYNSEMEKIGKITAEQPKTPEKRAAKDSGRLFITPLLNCLFKGF